MNRPHLARQCVCCGSARLIRSPAILMPFVAHRALGWAPVEIDASWGLKTIRQGNAYTICASLACQDCGLLFLDIRFSDDELAALYDDYRGAAYTDLRDHYEPGYAQRNAALTRGIDHLPAIEAFLAPWLPSAPVVLDWGGDTGQNTPFRGTARLMHIFDISGKSVLPGCERVTRDALAAQAYDLVVCSQVLEHVPYPADLLTDICSVLRAQTLLYIEVPFEGLMQSVDEPAAVGARKRHWHEHINFFTPEALRRLLARCGLTVIDLKVLAIGAQAEHRVLQLVARRDSSP